MSEATDITENYYAELCFCEGLEMISDEGVFKKIKEANSKIEMLYGFSYLDGKLTYEGTESKNFQGSLLAKVSFMENVAGEIRVLKNGTEIIAEKIINAYELILFTEFDEVVLDPGDFIEVYAKLEGGIVITDLKLMIIRK